MHFCCWSLIPGRPTGPSSPWQTSRKRAWLTQQSQAAFSVRRFGRGEKENTKKNRQRVLAKWEILLSKESHIFKNLTGPRKLNTCERSSLRDRQSRLDSSSEPRRWATRAGEIESSPEVLCTWSDTHRSRTSSRGGSVRTPDQDRERHTSRTSPTLSSTKRKKKQSKGNESLSCLWGSLRETTKIRAGKKQSHFRGSDSVKPVESKEGCKWPAPAKTLRSRTPSV